MHLPNNCVSGASLEGMRGVRLHPLKFCSGAAQPSSEWLKAPILQKISIYELRWVVHESRTPQGMDGTLTLIFAKLETI